MALQRATIVLRSDASEAIGYGHAMRSLALGEAFIERGWHVTFASAEPVSPLIAEASQASLAVYSVHSEAGSWQDGIEVADLCPDLTVVDGYHFDRRFFESLAHKGCPYVVIDDNGETVAPAPVAVINQNPHARAALYRNTASDSHLLLGLKYALLRKRITDASNNRAVTTSPGGVLLAMGGADPAGLTAPLARSLDQSGIRVRVAIGGATRHQANLIRVIEQLESATLVNRERFPEELAASSLAIVGAGTTLWEAAYHGVPALAMVVADNQREPAEAADRLGFAQWIECRVSTFSTDDVTGVVAELLADSEAMGAMSTRGRALVDGQGASRVASALEAISAVALGW